MIRFRQAAPLLAALALGCGALETPDLSHGALTGRIPNAQAGAYAYVLGSPEVYALAEADGSFRLDAVPAGQPLIVLFDGNGSAGLYGIQVVGGNIAQLDVYGLPAASAILAAVNPAAGVSTALLTFTVDGTRLHNVPGTAGARLWPLPPGSFTLRASLPGFHDALVSVNNLPEATDWPEVVSLDIDSESQSPGCIACGGCQSGLLCATDGKCVECNGNTDCNGGTGVCYEHRCMYPNAGTWCQACNPANGNTDCASGRSCLTVNASGGVVSGYCSYDCGTDCPAGYKCTSLSSGGQACEPLESCTAIEAAFGSSCSTDDPCKSALEKGRCYKPPAESGYCTAECTLAGGCPQSWTCSPTSIGTVCVKP